MSFVCEALLVILRVENRCVGLNLGFRNIVWIVRDRQNELYIRNANQQIQNMGDPTLLVLVQPNTGHKKQIQNIEIPKKHTFV